MEIFLLLSLIAIYFLPGIVASGAKHHQAAAIWILNLLLGWTILGWILALVWALTKPAPQVVLAPIEKD